MADLLEISSDIIDNGADRGPINRITHELSELHSGIAIVEAFSHSVVFATDAGLVVFDTSGAQGGKRVVNSIRGWSDAPFEQLIFTHGHIDHVGGSGAFVADAETRGDLRPAVAAHENVPRRFARYRLTSGYNSVINGRQFFGLGRRGYGIGGGGTSFLPEDVAVPDRTYRDHLSIAPGGLDIELHHARGETDDHSWAWIPRHRAICAGDFFIWNFPNAGNPQKVQRYPVEWAAALRAMAARDADLFIPAHGLPIAGPGRIRRVLLEVAEVLEQVVSETLEMMNQGARLDDILHTVKVAQDLLERPWLQPLYDEPEFLVRNVWRLYGGWYDGNPANLKPAPERALALELVRLGGGSGVFTQRALDLSALGEDRLACHLIETAALADPENLGIQEARAEIYQRRRGQETSLMAKGIFAHAVHESCAKAGLASPVVERPRVLG